MNQDDSSLAQWPLAVAASLSGLILLSKACFRLQTLLCRDCAAINCPLTAECDLFLEHWFASSALIATHLLPFFLMPGIMWIVHHSIPWLPVRPRSPFRLLLGLATIALASALELGWHVSQMWYYRNDFHFLNYLFYVALATGFALWADGFYRNAVMDGVFASLIVVAAICYPYGAEFGDSRWKIPMTLALSVTFLTGCYRGSVILRDWRMLVLVPFFSAGVNLYFVKQLQQLDPDVLSVDNYWHHLNHDLFGTEMGMMVFAYLVWTNPKRSYPNNNHNKAL